MKGVGYAVGVAVVIAVAYLIDVAFRRPWRAQPPRWPAGWRLALSFVLAAVLLESGFRVYLSRIHPIGKLLAAIYQADSQTDFALRPHQRTPFRIEEVGVDFVLDTNDRGWRGPEFGAKRASETRVLVLGDSFAFGFGVAADRTFAHLLETQLRTKTSRDITVVNAGVPGYGTEQELKVYRAHAATVAPTLVVLAFYPNDYEDNLKHYSFHSGFLMQKPLLFGGQASVALEYIAGRVTRPHRMLVDGDGYDGVFDETPTHTLLRELAAACARDGRPLLVLSIPDRESTKFSLAPGRSSRVHAPLPVANLVDLRPAIDGVDATPYLQDGHLNEKGHALASDLLVPAVVSVL